MGTSRHRFWNSGIPLLFVALLLLIAGAQPTLAASPPVTFDTTAGPNTFYAVGQDPDHVVVADFNGDGKPDMVIANTTASPGVANGDDAVTVLIGNGDGSFQAPLHVDLGTVGDGPAFVAVADFNGDGVLDLAVTLTNGAQVSDPTVVIALGNKNIGTGKGTGTFTVPSTKSLRFNMVPTGIAAGDFNHDNKQDLALIDSNQSSCDFIAHTCANGTVNILLGDGLGGFGAPTSATVGINPWNVVVGDFNGDGTPDLAVTNMGITGNVGTTVSILLGTVTGAFSPAVPVTVGQGPQGLAVGDFDGDNRLDLAVANSGSNDVSILLSNGNGTFHAGPGSPHPVGAGPAAVAIADFNGDGRLDLASADTNAPTTGTMTILSGTGDGAFAPGVPFTLPHHPDIVGTPPPNGGLVNNAGPIFIASGDFNGDGKPDVAIPFVLCETSFCFVSAILNTSPYATHLNVTPSVPTPNAGASFMLTVTARNPTNGVATGYQDMIHFTSTDPQATIANGGLPADYTFQPATDNGTKTFTVTLKTAGPQSITATDTFGTNITGTASVTVVPGAVTHLAVAGAPTVFASQNYAVTVSAADLFNNPVPAYTGTVHLTTSDPNARLPAVHTYSAGDNGAFSFGIVLNTDGSQMVTATDAASLTGTLTVSVSGPAIFSTTASPYGATPIEGPTTGGTTLTIAGNGFAGATVSVGGSACANPQVNGPGTQITCVTTAHAASTVDVVVTTPVAATTLSHGFTYVDPGSVPPPGTGIRPGPSLPGGPAPLPPGAGGPTLPGPVAPLPVPRP